MKQSLFPVGFLAVVLSCTALGAEPATKPDSNDETKKKTETKAVRHA